MHMVVYHSKTAFMFSFFVFLQLVLIFVSKLVHALLRVETRFGVIVDSAGGKIRQLIFVIDS